MIIFASVVGEVLNGRGYGIEHGFDTEAEATAWIAETETRLLKCFSRKVAISG